VQVRANKIEISGSVHKIFCCCWENGL